MVIRFDCPNCGKHLNVKDEFAEEKAECPGCRQVITIPAVQNKQCKKDAIVVGKKDQKDTVEALCHCGKLLKVPKDYIGTKIRCRYCKEEIILGSQCPNCHINLVLGEAYCDHCGQDLLLPVVFRPLVSIAWPNYCIGCFEANPPMKIKLDVYPACKASTGSKAGAMAGGFVGAMIGGIIGGVASGLARETDNYQLPICGRCLVDYMPAEDGKALADHEVRLFIGVPRIDTQLLSREFISWHVVLTFKNAAYSQAFRDANPGLVFDSVEASKSAQKNLENKSEKTTKTSDEPEVEKEPKQANTGTVNADKMIPGEKTDIHIADGISQKESVYFKKTIRNFLKSYLPQDGLFVHPDIPKKKLINATRTCKLPVTESVLGLIDCTTLGSAKNCLIFGCEGIYYHNGWTAKISGEGSILYTEFLTRNFMASGGIGEVSLDNNQYLNASGSSVPKGKIVDILLGIKQLRLEREKEKHNSKS